jgi:hypothetical protein
VVVHDKDIIPSDNHHRLTGGKQQIDKSVTYYFEKGFISSANSANVVAKFLFSSFQAWANTFPMMTKYGAILSNSLPRRTNGHSTIWTRKVMIERKTDIMNIPAVTIAEEIVCKKDCIAALTVRKSC